MINSVNDKLLSNAIHVTAKGPSGIFYGTGFFFAFNIKGFFAPMLVSAKHVFSNTETISFDINACPLDSAWPESYDQSHVEHIEIQGKNVISHPDSNIDLAILPLAEEQEKLVDSGFGFTHQFLSENDILDIPEWSSLSAIEDLVMIGCPDGIYDQVNNLPLIRSGRTASHPSYNFNGKPQFISDIACFPGSSGSPIFLYNPHQYMDYKKKSMIFGSSRIKLLGIQSAGFRHANESFNNLAIAVKATELLKFNEILLNLV